MIFSYQRGENADSSFCGHSETALLVVRFSQATLELKASLSNIARSGHHRIVEAQWDVVGEKSR
jgi:hypothetical protein